MKWIIKITITLTFLFISYTISEGDTVKHNAEYYYKIEEYRYYSLNYESIKYWTKKYNIKFPEVFIQQVIVETGELSSLICLENNNLTGMKFPYKRTTTAIGSQRGHALYKHWIESIRDYALWQDFYKCRLNEISTSKEYYKFLEVVSYSTNKRYTKILKRVRVSNHV